MRKRVERVEVLTCDAEGCGAELLAPAERLAARAEQAGWQHGVITGLSMDWDGPEVDLADRCPDHPVEALSDAEVLDRAGGPGGLDAGLLAQLRRRAR